MLFDVNFIIWRLFWDIIILLKFVILVLTVIWLYGDMDTWIGHGYDK